MSQTHNQLVASHEQMDLDEAQERVQRILHGQAGPTLTPQPQTQPQAPAPSREEVEDSMAARPPLGYKPAPRKKRSDAGVPKGPKKPAVERKGFLTVEQVAHLSKLIEEKNQAIEANTKAESAMLDACAALEKYLDELTIKK